MNNKLIIQRPHFDAIVFPEYLENNRKYEMAITIERHHYNIFLTMAF